MIYFWLIVASVFSFAMGIWAGVTYCRLMIAAMNEQLEEKEHWQNAADHGGKHLDGFHNEHA